MAPVSLNIKNERTHSLVRELASLQGMSQTDAVREAVELRLASLRQPGARDAKVADMLDIAREFRDLAGGVELTTDDLYDDETGLPR